MNKFFKRLFQTNYNIYYLNIRKDSPFTFEEWENFEEGLFRPDGVLVFHPLGHPIDERLITFLVKIDSNKTSIDKVINTFKKSIPDIYVENVTNLKDLEKHRLFITEHNERNFDINDVEFLLHKIEGIIYDFVQPNGQIEIYFLHSKTSIDEIIGLLRKNGYNVAKKL